MTRSLEPHFDRDGDDPGRVGRSQRQSYICTVCDWHGSLSNGIEHRANTGHMVRRFEPVTDGPRRVDASINTEQQQRRRAS